MFRSIGYRGVPDRGGARSTSGTVSIPNEEGRVVDPHAQHAIPGEYVVGWIKRGPSGVIGTNKRDAQETVDHLLEDLSEGRLPEPSDADPASVEALVGARKPDFVSYAGWEAIDAAEKAAGEPQGRPRVKLTRGRARCWTRHAARRRDRAASAPSAQGTERSADTDSPSSASSARSTGAEMQVKIGVSDSV